MLWNTAPHREGVLSVVCLVDLFWLDWTLRNGGEGERVTVWCGVVCVELRKGGGGG